MARWFCLRAVQSKIRREDVYPLFRGKHEDIVSWDAAKGENPSKD
jgi:hypothetical protein